ncbi:MAG: hypothetical protein ICV69_03965 [Thermoleophilaceae bacterium]|nr:hypothetical protein [Thermoleophilaceae bacterium]
MDLTLINLDSPTETRTFEKGRFETYRVGPMTLGRATYEPGWRVMKASDFFHVPPGHDSWVVGDQPYVSLHIMGSEHYAT